MYSNAFDSVRIEEENSVNTEGLLYASILNGTHPTFTLNQAIDSISFQNIISKHSIPLEFVNNGIIRVAKHKLFRDKNGQEIDAITGYMIEALAPVKDRIRNPYRFSSLPFLYKKYTDIQIQQIYNEMYRVIVNDFDHNANYQFNRQVGHNIGIISNSEDMDKIDNYLRLIISIRKAINGNYIAPTKQQFSKDLSTRLTESINFYESDEKKLDFHDALKILKKCMEKERNRTDIDTKEISKRINSRSVIYDIIERELLCDQPLEDEIKSLVDLCYNKVVADSIQDNEKSLFTNDVKYSNTEKYFKATGNGLSTQELALIKRTKGFDSNHITWDTLSGILENVNADRNDREKWIEEVEKYCCQVRLNNIKLSVNGLISGAFTFPFMVDSISKFANHLLNKEWGLAIMAFFDTCYTVKDSVEKIAPGVEQVIDTHKENKEYCEIKNLLTDSPKNKSKH